MESKEHVDLIEMKVVVYYNKLKTAKKNKEISLLEAKVLSHILKCDECRIMYETLEDNIERKQENKPKTI